MIHIAFYLWPPPFGRLCVFTRRFWLHSLSTEEKASNVDWGIRLIAFICGSTVWGKQERPLPEEREAQALNVPGDVRKTKSDPVQLVLLMWLWDDEYKAFSIFFLKNMAAALERKALLNLALWNMSRHLELHSLNTPPESLWRKPLLFISLNAPANHGGGQEFRVCFIICCHFKVLLSCSLLCIHFILVLASRTKCSVFKLLRLAHLQEILGRRPLLCKISLAGTFQLTQAVQGGHNVHM